jgi:hypothetical protein
VQGIKKQLGVGRGKKFAMSFELVTCISILRLCYAGGILSADVILAAKLSRISIFLYKYFYLVQLHLSSLILLLRCALGGQEGD